MIEAINEIRFVASEGRKKVFDTAALFLDVLQKFARPTMAKVVLGLDLP